MSPYNELNKNYEYALDAIRAALRCGRWDKWGDDGQKVEDILSAALANSPAPPQEFWKDLYLE
jgi:hypothetical protein